MSRRKRRPPAKPHGRAKPAAGFGVQGLQENSRKPIQGKPASRRFAGLWLLLAAVVIVAGAILVLTLIRPGRGTPVKRDSRMNVVLITMDTTRADHVGCYGYAKATTPNLDALA